MCPTGSQLTHTGDSDTAHPTPEGPSSFQRKPEQVDAHPDTAPAWSRTRPRCLLWARIWEMLPSPTIQMTSVSNSLPHKQFHWLQRDLNCQVLCSARQWHLSIPAWNQSAYCSISQTVGQHLLFRQEHMLRGGFFFYHFNSQQWLGVHGILQEM